MLISIDLAITTREQLFQTVKFPVGKNTLIQVAQQHNANSEIIDLLQKLPDKTFNSPQDIPNELGGLGDIGGFKL